MHFTRVTNSASGLMSTPTATRPDQRIAGLLSETRAVECHQHAFGDMFLVYGVRLEENGLAPRVTLAIDERAQASLHVVVFGVLGCEYSDLSRNCLAGRELDLDAGAFREPFLQLAALGPGREGSKL